MSNVQIAQLVLVDQKNIALKTFTAEGKTIGDARIEAFSDRLLEQLSEDNLRAFSDPGFQILARQAQVAAACSGDESDYDLLIQLLAERAEDDTRAARSGISKAVEVVDEVDSRALHALSLHVLLLIYSPQLSTVAANLDRFEGILSGLGVDGLPTGPRWLEHLDTLGLVRVTYGGLLSLKSYEETLAGKMAGYLSPGLSTEAAEEFNAELTARGFDNFNFAAHEYNVDAVRLPYPNENQLEAALRVHGVSEDSVVAIKALAAERAQFGVIDAGNQSKMLAESDRRPTLLSFRLWHDALALPFIVSELGRIVALANLHRLLPDWGVPRFDFSI